MLSMFLLTGFVAVALNAGEWRRDVVDAAAGSFSSLRVDANGNAHVAHFDSDEGVVKYSFWDRMLDKWFTTTLDKSRGFCSLVLDSKQHPHISYLGYGDGPIKYAHWNGTAWEKQGIHIRAKDISFYTSIALDAKENPTISYYHYWGTTESYTLSLRMVFWTGTYWGVRTVDSTPGSGKFNAIATDPSGNSHIAYANVKSENMGLRYARWNGQSWEVQVLNAWLSPNVGASSVAIVVDREGNPHIAFTEFGTNLVRYAVSRAGKWTFETIAQVAEVGYPERIGLALDAQGNPYISYFDVGSGLLQVAHHAGQKWLIEIVDQNGAGFNSSLQVAAGSIWVTYRDESGRGLKCARRPLEEAPPVPAPPQK